MTEKRHAGAMLLIHNDQDVFALLEKSKEELAVGFPPVFFQALPETLSTIAGGRDADETTQETLERETQEELSEAGIDGISGIALPENNSKQPYPFIVAQKRNVGTKSELIDEVAVTSVHVNWAELDPLLQEMLARTIELGKGKWIPLEKLHQAFLALRNSEMNVAHAARPQFLVAATLYYLEKIRNWDRARVSALVRAMNHRMVDTVIKNPQVVGTTPVNNGVFNPSGLMSEYLSQQEKVYLI